ALINRWYEDVASLNLSYNTLRSYKSIIKNHIQGEIGHLKLTSITPILMQKFLVDKSKYCGNTTLLHTKIILKSVLDFAVKQKLIKQNPINLIEGVGKRKKRIKDTFLTKEDITHILSEIKDTDYYLPALIAINTGMRRGEVLGLTWDDIDLDNHIIDVNKQLLTTRDGLIFSDLKTAKSKRRFLITHSFAETLKQFKCSQIKRKDDYEQHYYTEFDFVCCRKDGRPINPDCITTFFTNKSKNLDLPFSFHDFRHAHASLLLEADVNVKVIQERLGHSQISTTLDVYSHITHKLERDSITKFEKVFATQS
ncbi:MAG: site-specific integrase, partial [Turicibacter sp.]|nr:site-specific integrase [Turicibacter sp.]